MASMDWVAEPGNKPPFSQHESCVSAALDAVCAAEGWDKHQTTQSVLSNICHVMTYRAGGGCCAPRNTVRNSSEQLLLSAVSGCKTVSIAGLYLC